jgi:hypothetical protein
MGKVAIYTVLTGGYDKLMQPQVTDERFNYICFSNDIPKDHIGVWEIRKFDGEFSSKQIESRYPKMHPWIVLPEYDYSVYMDANISVASKDFYECIIQKIESGVILSGIKHPFRDCCYDEGYAVITYNLDKIANIIKTMRFIRKQGFPRHYGMFEANIILRKHGSEKVHQQCELWWEMINKYSRRDQLSYPYTLWKSGIAFDYLLPENENARNCPWLHMEQHKREKNIWGKSLNRIGRFVYRKLVGFEK